VSSGTRLTLSRGGPVGPKTMVRRVLAVLFVLALVAGAVAWALGFMRIAGPKLVGF